MAMTNAARVRRLESHGIRVHPDTLVVTQPIGIELWGDVDGLAKAKDMTVLNHVPKRPRALRMGEIPKSPVQ